MASRLDSVLERTCGWCDSMRLQKDRDDVVWWGVLWCADATHIKRQHQSKLIKNEYDYVYDTDGQKRKWWVNIDERHAVHWHTQLSNGGSNHVCVRVCVLVRSIYTDVDFIIFTIIMYIRFSFHEELLVSICKWIEARTVHRTFFTACYKIQTIQGHGYKIDSWVYWQKVHTSQMYHRSIKRRFQEEQM